MRSEQVSLPRITPMPLARLDRPLDHPDRIFEPKLDGFRIKLKGVGGILRQTGRLPERCLRCSTLPGTRLFYGMGHLYRKSPGATVFYLDGKGGLSHAGFGGAPHSTRRPCRDRYYGRFWAGPSRRRRDGIYAPFISASPRSSEPLPSRPRSACGSCRRAYSPSRRYARPVQPFHPRCRRCTVRATCNRLLPQDNR